MNGNSPKVCINTHFISNSIFLIIGYLQSITIFKRYYRFEFKIDLNFDRCNVNTNVKIRDYNEIRNKKTEFKLVYNIENISRVYGELKRTVIHCE